MQAIRNDRFKLVFPHTYRTLNGHPGGTGGLPVAYQQKKIGLSLFDLDSDVSETKNVIDEFPEVVTGSCRSAPLRAWMGFFEPCESWNTGPSNLLISESVSRLQGLAQDEAKYC